MFPLGTINSPLIKLTFDMIELAVSSILTMHPSWAFGVILSCALTYLYSKRERIRDRQAQFLFTKEDSWLNNKKNVLVVSAVVIISFLVLYVVLNLFVLARLIGL